MKKLSVACLCFILCLLCPVGCTDKTDKHGFYAQSTLNKNFIPDLPKIKSDGKTSLNQGRFTFTTTEKEFEEYLNSVYDYLASCSFEYFGYPTEVFSTLFGGAPKCTFEFGYELSDFQTLIALSIKGEDIYEEAKTGKHYFFVWGKEGADNQSKNDRQQIVNARYLQIGCYPHDDYVYVYMELKYSLMDYTFYLSSD